MVVVRLWMLAHIFLQGSMARAAEEKYREEEVPQSKACPMSKVWNIELNTNVFTPKDLRVGLWEDVKKNIVAGSIGHIYNNSGSERLTVVFHPGSVQGQYSEFKVELSASPAKSKALRAATDHFESSGIKLGMKPHEIFKKLAVGMMSIQRISDKTVYVFQDRNTNEPCLKNVNMPLYYLHLVFDSRQHLVEYSFGYPYP